MRFYWFQASVATSPVGASTAISVAAHALLVGLAVYGTAIRARELSEAREQADSVRYLPPPDRRPNREALVEHLAYIDIGNAADQLAKERPDGYLPKFTSRDQVPKPGGDPGKEAESQAPSSAYASPDSVFSVLEVEERAVRTEGSAAPAYPPDLVKNGTEGGVFIRFIVDTTGRPDPASLEIIRASHAAFEQSVRDALPLMRFTPATVGGRRVRQAVEQNFEFKILTPQPVSEAKPRPSA